MDQGSVKSTRRHPDWGLKVDGKGVYALDFEIAGHRVRRSAFTTDRAKARELRDKEAANTWHIAVKGEQPAVSWAQASLEWLDHQRRRNLSTIEDIKDKLRWLSSYLDPMDLSEITEGTVSTIMATKRRQGAKTRGKKRKPVSDATLNRYYAVISAVFHFAIRKGWATHCPRFAERVSEAAGRQRTVRWLTPEQWEQLRDELPLHLRQMARFAIATGLRQANVTLLEWSRVDLERKVAWISSANSKSGRSFSVPLNSEAMAVLREQAEAPDRDKQWAFPYKGMPLDNPAGLAWHKAKARAGIDPKFRWHDLRHTWASWHVQNGTPLEALMQLGNWHSFDMVLAYAHLGEGHLAHAAENAVKAVGSRQDRVIGVNTAAQQSERSVDALTS